MCGRFTQDLDSDDLVDLYGLDSTEGQPEFHSRWNGAPTQEFVLCRTDSHGRRILAVHRWGLIPAWARDPKIGARLINGRAETIDSKASFRGPFRHRRCLIPANGWFEWQRTATAKQPWWISLGGRPFSFAGLWDLWDRGGDPVASFTIVTCPATGSLEEIHDRQPAIMPMERYQEWLDRGTPLSRLIALAQTPYKGPFECRRVGSDVNSSRNDYPEILQPAPESQPLDLQP